MSLYQRKRLQKGAKAKEMSKPNLGGNKKKIRIFIKEGALPNTEGTLSRYFTESKSCLDIYRDNRADGT